MSLKAMTLGVSDSRELAWVPQAKPSHLRPGACRGKSPSRCQAKDLAAALVSAVPFLGGATLL